MENYFFPNLNKFKNIMDNIIKEKNMNLIENYINSLSTEITELNISSLNIIKIPNLSRFKKLEKLNCFNNRLEELNNLPSTLIELICCNNIIQDLGILPNFLKVLDCSSNRIHKIINLPSTLEILDCSDNMIEGLHKLPLNLNALWCNNNALSNLYYLPLNVEIIVCSENYLENESLQYWKSITKFRIFYYTLKFLPKFFKQFLNFIKRRKEKLHLELLYSPKFNFYKQFIDQKTLDYFSAE